jgi:hypothetical protein
MLSPETLERCVARVALMAYFPAADESSCAVIAEEIAAMCAEDDKAVWLVNHFTAAHKRWPGIGEFRAFFCAVYQPLDGIHSYSEIYPDGVPRSLLGKPPGALLSAPAPRMIAPPAREIETTRDPEMRDTVGGIARVAAFPAVTEEDREATARLFYDADEDKWRRQSEEWNRHYRKISPATKKTEWLRLLELEFVTLATIDQREDILKKLRGENKPASPGLITEADFAALKGGIRPPAN